MRLKILKSNFNFVWGVSQIEASDWKAARQRGTKQLQVWCDKWEVWHQNLKFRKSKARINQTDQNEINGAFNAGNQRERRIDVKR